MSIATAITNAQNKVAACYTSVDTMGGTLPETQNLTNLPTAIESIPTGGGTTYPGLDTDYTNGLATINKGALRDYSVSDVTETGCIAKYGNIYNNFKIFGNPTINFNTGVVGGFGYNDYIQLPKSVPTSVYCSTMDMIFLVNMTDATGINSILSQVTDLKFIGVMTYFCLYNNGTNYPGTTVIESNKKYWFRVIFDGTTWKGYLLEDDDYILSRLPDISQWSYEWATTADIFRGQTLNMGRNYGQSSHTLKGSHNLSQAVIYVNGVEWWNARGNSAVVKNIQYSNFTVVGSPAVNVDTGIVRDITDTSYINMPKAFPSNVDYADMIFKGKINDFSTTHSVLFNFNNGNYSFIVRYTTQKFSCYANAWVEGTNVLSLNTWYWFRVKYDGTTWTGYTLEDNNYTLDTLPFITDWRQEWTTTSSMPISGTLCGIGTNAGARAQHWYGVLDLSQSKMDIGVNAGGGSLVTINWWTAKKNVYQQTQGLYGATTIPSGTSNLNIYYFNGARNYGLYPNGITPLNGAYGGTINITGFSNYPSYSISPNWGFVGTPTYNNTNMSYSGFNQNNYIRTNYNFEMSTAQFAKGFTIQMHIKTPSSWGGSSDHNFVFSQDGSWLYYSFFCVLANGKAQFILATGGSDLLAMSSSTSLSTNTEYWIRVVKPDTRYFSDDTVMQISTDGENWTTDATISISSISTDISNGKLRVGAYNDYWYMRGAVYLDGTFIDFNNGDDTTTRVWDMVKETEMTPEPTPPTRVYDNFTTVGSPTINQSTGVVSGFSLSDYATLPNRFDASSNTWEMVWKVNYVDSEDQYQPIFGSTSYMGGDSGLSLATNNGKCCLWLSENGYDDWAMLNGVTGTTTMSNNTTYYVRVSFTGTHYLVELSTDGATWNTEIDFTSSTPIHSFPPCFGQVEQWNDWHGSIDLSESYIKINGQTWWVGYTES